MGGQDRFLARVRAQAGPHPEGFLGLPAAIDKVFGGMKKCSGCVVSASFFPEEGLVRAKMAAIPSFFFQVYKV